VVGSKTGGAKLRETMITKFGTEEAWRAWMRTNSAKGGSKTGIIKGFASPTVDAQEMGRLGGKKSRRGKGTK